MVDADAAVRYPDLAGVDVYRESLAAAKLCDRLKTGAPLRLACLDIDSTLTGNPALADAVREQLETQGWVVSFVTSRTEEMVMSAATYQRTRQTSAFSRPRPQLGTRAGRRVYVAPEEHESTGILDGDLIAGSSGTQLLVRQRGGVYLPDPVYAKRAGDSPERWREGALWVVHELQARGCRLDLAGIEDPENYAAGRSDIYLPDFRIQLNFPSLAAKQRSLTALVHLRHAAAEHASEWTKAARNLRLTDDSHPGRGGYKLFLTPRRLSKVQAAERMVECLCRGARVDRSRLIVFFAGDSFPDLMMGLFGAVGTSATLLLVGGSRLVDSLIEPDAVDFAGEPLGAIRRRLSVTDRGGVYRFRPPIAGHNSRTVIVGDQRFPGTEAVETVHAYLNGLTSEDNDFERTPVP